MRTTIKLKDYLTIVDSCHYNYYEKFCPVLVKIGKDYYKHLEKPEADMKTPKSHRYLLQIWLRKVVKTKSLGINEE